MYFVKDSVLLLNYMMLLEGATNLDLNTTNVNDFTTYEEKCTYSLNNDHKDYNLTNTNYYSSLETMSSEDELDKELQALRKKLISPELLEDWSPVNTLKWFTDLYISEGINYESTNLHLLKNTFGSDLETYNIDTFSKIDSVRCVWLYGKVQELIKSSAKSKVCDQIEAQLSNIKAGSSIDDVNNTISKHRKRGRPRTTNRIRRKSEHKTGKLWEFIRDMLHNPEYCPSIIRWENHEEGTFKFVCSVKVAQIWGSKRGNDGMNYENFSRAMRYYYRSEILQPVRGKRLVYQFGKNAKGWRTNNPNFEIIF